MNLFINASNLRFGGGLTVALSLLNATLPLRLDDHFFIACPAGMGYEALTAFGNVTLKIVPPAFHTSPVAKLKYNWLVFPRWCIGHHIHKAVSLGNVAFSCQGIPHLLYIQLPFLAYPESPAWKQMAWRSFLRNSLMEQYVTYYMRYATSFAVQTEVMRARLGKRFSLNADNIFLLPNAAITNKAVVQKKFSAQKNDGLRLLFLSKYYPHKNFECLVPLGKIVQARNIPARITLTIEAGESPGAAAVLKDIQDAGLSDMIQTIGDVPMADIAGVLDSHDAVFLPTLLESFSGAYAEALQAGKIILTSHYDFATSLLGDAAFYFDPLKPEAIADTIDTVIKSPDLVAQKLEKSALLAQQMPDWPQIGALFSGIIDTFV